MPLSTRIRLHLAAWAVAVLLAGMRIDPAIATDPLDDEVEAEIAIIASTHGLAVRDGDELRIKAANGKTQTFRTAQPYLIPNVRDWAHTVFARLVAYIPERQAFIIHTTLSQSEDKFTWISATSGDAVDLKSMPHYSPNGNLIAVVLDNGPEVLSEFEIWQVRNDTFELMWEHQSHGEFCDFVSWESNTSILLSCRMWRGMIHPAEPYPARLVYNTPGHPGWDSRDVMDVDMDAPKEP